MKILVTQTQKTVAFTNQIKAQFEQVESIDLNNDLSKLAIAINEAKALIIPINKEHLQLIGKQDWEVLMQKHKAKSLKVLPVLIEETSWLYMPYAAVFPVFPKNKTNLTESNFDPIISEIKTYLISVDSPIKTKEKDVQASTPITKKTSFIKDNGHSQTNLLLAKAKEAESKGNLKNAVEFYKDLLHLTTNGLIIIKHYYSLFRQ